MFSLKNVFEKFNWRLEINFLKLLISNNGESYTSKVFPVKGYDKLWFSFTLKTNVRDDENNGFVWIYFNCFTGYQEVKADLGFNVKHGSTFFLKFQNSKKMECNFTKSGSQGFQLLDNETLLGLNSAFIYFTCKTNFTIKSFACENCFLSKKLLNSEQKDLKIIAGENEIMVHKIILETFSPIFKRMIEASDGDAKIEITDCNYEVVKNAINFCYGIKDSIPSDFDTLISYLQFSNKYEIDDLKAEVEFKLIQQISKENICKLSNAAIQSNATGLKAVCKSKLTELLKDYKTRAMIGIDDLDKDFAKEVLQNLCINQGFIGLTDRMLCILLVSVILFYLLLLLFCFDKELAWGSLIILFAVVLTNGSFKNIFQLVWG